MRKFITDILAKTNLGVEQNAYVLGTVGIGTASPGARFHSVADTSSDDTAAIIQGTGSLGSGLHLQASGASGRTWRLISTGTSSTPGAGTLGFYDSTAGLYRFVINTSGNVGIGTTSPGEKLDVNGDARFTGFGGRSIVLRGGGSGKIEINGDGATYATGIQFNSQLGGTSLSGIWNYGSGTTQIWMSLGGTSYDNGPLFIKANGNIGIGTYNTDNYATSGRRILSLNGSSNTMLEFKVADSSYAYIYRDSRLEVYDANRIDLSTNGSIRATIDSSGNVGIGTSTPSYKLNVVATSATDADIFQAGMTGVSNGFSVQRVSSAFKYTFVDGNVGIGTTAPKQRLIVEGIFATKPSEVDGYYSYLRSNWNENDAFELGISENGSSNFHKLITSSNYYFGSTLQFWTADVERIRIISNGNVGIGTTSPTGKLHVGTYGTVGPPTYSTANGDGLLFDFFNSGSPYTRFGRIVSSAGDASEARLNFFTKDVSANPTEKLTILGNGNVGIGTTSPSSTLDVSSSANATTMTITSDGANEQFRIRRYSDNNKQLIFGYHSSNFGTIQAVEQGVNYRNLILEPYGGNVGIGTTSPDHKLSVSANQTTNDWGMVLQNTNTGGYGVSQFFNLYGYGSSPAADFSALQIRADYPGYGRISFVVKEQAQSTALESLVLRGNGQVYMNSGNVGIGTTSPAAKLHIAGNLGSTVGGGNSAIKMTNTDTGNFASISAGIVGITNSGMEFSIDGSRAMVISGSGNVGIGTTSPGTKLQVEGNIYSNNVGGNSFTLNSYGANYGFISTTANNTFSLGYGPSLGTLGTPVLTWNSSGNVGIGTTSPGWKLDVIGDVRASSYFVGGASGQGFSWSNFTYGSYIDVDNSQNALRIRNTSSTIMLEVNGYLNYFTGKLGIGNNNPTYNLDVTGTGRFTSGLLSDSLNATNYPYNLTLGTSGADAGSVSITAGSTVGYNSSIYVGGGGASVAPNNIVFNTASAERMRITSGGNVGIGTTDPVEKLQVTNGNISIRNTSGGTWGSLRFGTTNTSYLTEWAGIDSDWEGVGINVANLRFYTSYGSIGERMRITSQGNVGIGTTSPTQKLHLYGSGNQLLFIENSSTYHLYAGISSNVGILGSNNATPLSLQTNGVSRVYLDTSGNVGIGTASPFNKLTIGSIPASGYGLITISSDWASGTAISTGIKIGAANDTGGAGVDIRSHSNYAASSGTEMSFWTNSTGNVLSEYMRITNSGNVGIGTTAPVEALHIAKSGGGRAILEATSGSGVKWQMNSWTDGKLYIGVYQIADYLTLTSGGNVGIGTTSPEFPLHVARSSGDSVIVADSGASSNSQFRFQEAGLVRAAITYVSSDASVRFYNSGDHLVIKGGNVGIGTTNPTGKLTISQNNSGGVAALTFTEDESTIQGPSANTKILMGGNLSLNAASTWVAATNGSERMRITSVGNVGIGTTSPLKRLHVAQDLTYSASQSGQLYVGGATDTNKRLMLGYDTTNNFAFIEGVNFGAAYSNVCINPAYGNVGIGTTSPVAALHVQSSSTKLFLSNTDFVANTTGSGMILHTGASSGNTYSQIYAFQSGNTAYANLVIPGGNVGIGTTSPLFNLQVGANSGTLATTTIRLQNSYLDTNGYYGFNIDAVDNGVDGHDLRFLGRTSPTGTFSELVRIKNSGNVGIGTTSPQKKLEVLIAASDFASVGVNTLAIGEWTGIHFGYRESNSLYRKSAIIFQRTGGAAQGKIHFLNNIAADNSSATLSDSKMVISDDGNVGIGTTSPAHKLDVSGNISVTASTGTKIGFNVGDAFSAYSTSIAHYGISWGWNALPTALSGYYGLGFFSQGAERMRIAENGNVGIGTSNPAYKLDVFGIDDTTPEIRIGNSSGKTAFIGFSSTYGFDVDAGGVGGNYLNLKGGANGSTGGITFSTFALERMRIDYTGNVGIGTSSPGAKLHVVGNTQVSDQFAQGVAISSKITNYGAEFRSSGASAQIFFGRSGDSIGSGAIGADASYALSVWNTSDFSRFLVISQAGNVGIGTTSPSAKLHTQGTGPVFVAQSTDDSVPARVVNLSNAVSTIGFQANGSANSFNVRVGCDVSDFIAYTNNTERFRITSGGNVGIGTTSPAYKLDIGSNTSETVRISAVATSGSTGNLLFGSNTIVSQAAKIQGLYGGSWDGTLVFYTQTAGATDGDRMTEKVRISSNGNVGIGTTSPSSKLHINTSSGDGLKISTADVATIKMGSTTGATSHWGFATTNLAASDFGIYQSNSAGGDPINAGTARLYFNGSGNVGIGTTSPGYKLDVSGIINTTSSPGSYGTIIRIRDTVTSGTESFGGVHFTSSPGTDYTIGKWTTAAGVGLLQIRDQSGNQFVTINSSGNVGIGTTSPSYKLHVEGNVSGISIYASHDIAAFSDITVKKDVERIENAIEKVKELNGYTYVRTDDETGTRRAGVIAQEVQKVLPEVVSQNPDGTLNVAYANMIALLIEGMKEQQATIERLEDRIKQLEK